MSLPVVTSDGFCVKGMFKDGQNAKVAKIGNKENSNEFEANLTNAILELSLSDNLCYKLGNNGRMIYESLYQKEHMVNGYKTLLKKYILTNI